MKKLKTVGVIGGGQLAQMMAIAAQDLGIELIVLADSPSDPAATFAKTVSSVPELVNACDLITFENEFVDLQLLQQFADQGAVFMPAIATLAILVDKFSQRTFLAENQILVPDFYAINDQTELEAAAQSLGFPLVIKARRHGYDGKGTEIIHNQAELLNAWQKMGKTNLLAEAFIPFSQELAVMVVRDQSAEVVCYPVVETQQRNQVCMRAIAPANVSLEIEQEVNRIAQLIANSLNLVGILGIEFFLLADGKLLVNEIAPRTHNSAHLTIEACETSQFSQLVRLASGMPLASAKLKVNGAVMVNLLGFEEHEGTYSEVRAKIVELPKVYLHWYGKTKSLPGRKLGHVTVIGETRTQAIATAQEVELLWYGKLLN